jgi:hypothetical protein
MSMLAAMRRSLGAIGSCLLFGGFVSAGCGRSPTGGARDAGQGVDVLVASGGALGSGGATVMGGAGGAGGGDGGGPGIYTGCSYIGGYDRAVVAKFDPQAGACVVVALMAPVRADASTGLTITSPWWIEYVTMWSSTTAECLSKGVRSGAAQATSASGSVTVNWSPATIDIDAILTFQPVDGGPSQSVELKAQGVDLDRSCSTTG